MRNFYRDERGLIHEPQTQVGIDEAESRGWELLSDEESEAIITPGKPQQSLDDFKDELRPLRDKLVVRVVDIGSAAAALASIYERQGLTSEVTEQEAIAMEAFHPTEGIRRRLLDITDDPALNAATTREERETAVLAYYGAIVGSVSAPFRSAFKEMDA